MSWINDLDALASAGVIDFDAPAYIYGTKPRYYGNPAFETIPPNLPKPQQPQSDIFDKNPTPVKNPSWKKWLFGALATGGIIFGASKLKFVKKLFKKINLTNLKTIPSKIINGVKTGWQKLLKFLKIKP